MLPEAAPPDPVANTPLPWVHDFTQMSLFSETLFACITARFPDFRLHTQISEAGVFASTVSNGTCGPELGGRLPLSK